MYWSTDDEVTSDFVALLCVYDEAKLLPECLASLEGIASRVVIADGRYAKYPGDHDASNDGTVELARAWARAQDVDIEVIQCPRGGWPTEHGKRTALVQAGRLGDECLVIDADERLVADPSLTDIYGEYRVDVVGQAGTPGQQDAVRLFRWRPGLEYRFHFGLYTQGNENIMDSPVQLPRSTAYVAHFHHLRDDERVTRDKVYEQWLVPFEQSLGAYGGRT